VGRQTEHEAHAADQWASLKAADTYVLGRSEAETRRLMLQHRVYGPLTRRLFEAAGIGAGMKVLDVGSGAGDVALLLADMVGPTGRVVGIDTNAEILQTARARVDAAGLTNVTFQVEDVMNAALPSGFDAVVGRWILMHLPNPVAAIRFLATRVHPGGIVAFHESDFTYPPTTFPPSELSEQVVRWSIPPAHLAPGGPNTQMGTQLFRDFVDAGLPAPNLRTEAPMGGGPDWPGYELVAETLRSLMPALQRMGIVNPAEVDIDTLAERLRDDAVAGARVQMLPIVVGAWSRRPA
jgi:2-polyprenyl-3-methyl-5-hydroxy-6-metoxy-1,4-benzoquinol methylase